MPRSLLIRLLVVVVAIVAVLVALSMVDSSKAPRQIVRPLPADAPAR